MHEIQLVHGLERGEQRQATAADLVEWHPVLELRQPIVEGRQRDELHHQRGPPVRQRRPVVERRRVDATELVQGVALQLEAHDRVRLGHRDLHGDLAAVGDALREQDLAEATTSQHALHHQPVNLRHRRGRFDLRRFTKRPFGGRSRGLRRDLGGASGVHRFPPAPALGASGPNALHQLHAIIGRNTQKCRPVGVPVWGPRPKKRPARRSGPALFEALRPVRYCARTLKSWLLAPVQGIRSIRAPLALLAPATSKHMPGAAALR